MSGGEFNYDQYKLNNIIERIEEILNNQGKDIPRDERGFGDDEYYKLYPEESKYPEYSERVQDMFRLAILNLKVAFTFAHRIDYFLSSDDGEDSFMKRLSEELENIIKEDGEVCGFTIVDKEEEGNN
jgi:hypothetical protein